MTALASVPRWKLACWAAAVLLLLIAAVLPVDTVVEALARRYNTARGFRSDFVRGLQLLRVACAVNGLVLGALPFLLSGARFAPAGAPEFPRGDRLPALALYAVAMALAAPGLRESFQNDEWRCLEQYIRHGPLVIVTRSNADNHVLYSLLAWPAVKLFGMTEPAVRLPAFLLGPLAPALLYVLLRRRHARGPAFLSALPLALCAFLTAYTHEGRAYAVLFPAILGLRLLQPAALSGSRRAWRAWIGLGIATVYLHLYGSLAVAGLAMGALLLPEGRTPEGRARLAASFLLIAGFSFLLYAPTLPQVFHYSETARSLGLPRGTLGAAIGEAFVFTLPAVLSIPFVVTLLAGLVAAKRPTPDGAACVLTGVLLLALTAAAGSECNARFFTPALVPGWICLSDRLARLAKAGAPGLVLAGLLATLSATGDANYLRQGRRDFREAARRMAALRNPGETYAALFDCRPMTAYLREPPTILTAAELMARPPDWFTVVDVNLKLVPGLEERLDREYRPIFRLPSARGEIRAYRRK